MIGAITGGIVGSIYKGRNIKTKEFPLFGEGCRFTDDTVCTVAVGATAVTRDMWSSGLPGRRSPVRRSTVPPGVPNRSGFWTQSVETVENRRTDRAPRSTASQTMT
jgi:hypothetical protein